MLKINGKNIVKDVKVCKSVWSKALGLMFSRPIKDECLVFEFGREKIIALHMFFVFYPIDVLWLDKNKKIVEIKKNFMPFTFYTPKSKAKYVVEMEAGIINKYQIRVGQKINNQ